MAGDHRILVRPEPPEPAEEPTLVWVPCGRCWGQRQVFYETADGLVPLTCQDCGGLGDRLTTEVHR